MSVRRIHLHGVAVGHYTSNKEIVAGSHVTRDVRVRAVFHLPTLERLLGKAEVGRSGNLWLLDPQRPLHFEGVPGGVMLGHSDWTIDGETLLLDAAHVILCPLPAGGPLPPDGLWQRRTRDLRPSEVLRIKDSAGRVLYTGPVSDVHLHFPNLDPQEPS